jgi:hypothetical protein
VPKWGNKHKKLSKKLVLNYEILKPISEVYYYLSDMNKYVLVHPIIYKIDKISENYYSIFETLKIGLFPIKVKYPAQIDCDFKAKRIKMTAQVLKMIKIEIVFNLKTSGTKTSIEETITFNSFIPIGIFLASIFKNQHQILFKNIENHAN